MKAEKFETCLKPLSEFRPEELVGEGKLQKIKLTVEERQKAFEDGFEQGYEEGYEEGLKAGHVEGTIRAQQEVQENFAEKIEAFNSRLEYLFQQFLCAVEEWYKHSEEQLARLAVFIAEKLLGHELQYSRESALVLAQEAIKALTHGNVIKLRVNPFDVAILEAYKEKFLATAPRLENIEIVADGSIQGGCLIETEGGIVDARLEHMFEKMIHEVRLWRS
jgi:flagellar assembly protein FliH